MSSVVLLGAGGHARETLQALRAVGGTAVAFAIPDAGPGQRLAGLPVWDEALVWEMVDSLHVVVAVGRPGLRAKLRSRTLEHPRLTLRNVVHPAATVLSDVTASGVYIGAGAVVTVDVRIGDGALLNFACSVGHDAVIGPDAVVYPQAAVSGGVRVGARAMIGSGAVLREGVQVGDDAVVGAGAVVVRDVAPGSTVTGVPAVARP